MPPATLEPTSTMENEKAAIKRSSAHEGRFQDEFPKVIESLVGSCEGLDEATSADDRIQRELTKTRGTASPCSLSAQNPENGFQTSDNHPEPRRISIRTALARIQELGLNDESEKTITAVVQHQTVVDSVAIPTMDDTTYYATNEEPRRPKFENACYIIVAIIFAVAIAGIAGGSVAFVNRAGTSLPTASPMALDEGAATHEKCKLDRNALADCEDSGLVVPDCATDRHHELAAAYSDFLSADTAQECDAAHKAIVALAVSQVNYGEDVVGDPVMFFAMSTL